MHLKCALQRSEAKYKCQVLQSLSPDSVHPITLPKYIVKVVSLQWQYWGYTINSIIRLKS